MTSKERIKKIFTHQIPDRVGIADFFDNITTLNWKKQGLLPDEAPAEYFDFDFRLNKPGKNKFNLLSFNGPFQQLIGKKGLQKSLMDFVREPKHTRDFFKDCVENIFKEYKNKASDYDAVWLYEDIAYDNGLYFSSDKYKDVLLDFHKEISDFFRAEGKFIVFHCDGHVEGLVPTLVKLRFSGIHPLQESCNPNLIRLKKDLKNAIIFLGGIGITRLRGLHQDILERVDELKQDGNYIFCFDGPIPDDTEFNTYKDIITQIKTIGRY